jgi:hypothetical protein
MLAELVCCSLSSLMKEWVDMALGEVKTEEYEDESESMGFEKGKSKDFAEVKSMMGV